MKEKYRDFSKKEIEMLSNQLDPREFYILGFLKGFDRKTLKEWSKKGLIDFSIEN